MNSNWRLVPLALICFFAPHAASSQTKSPKEAVTIFWTAEIRGARLTSEGWYRAADFFAACPSPPSPTSAIHVVSPDFTVDTPVIQGKKTTVFLGTEEFGTIDADLRFERFHPPPAPDHGPVLAGLWFKYDLILSSTHWVFAAGELQEVDGAAEWRMDGFQRDIDLDLDTAVRYVTDSRDKSGSAAIKRNADKTLAILKGLHPIIPHR